MLGLEYTRRELVENLGRSFPAAGPVLGVGLEPRLGPLSAAYVLLLAVLGPILARAAK